MSASSWIILAAIYMAITSSLLVGAWWLNRAEPTDDPRGDHWLYIAAIFWPLFVLVAMISG